MKASVKYKIIRFKNFDTNIRAAVNEIMTNAIRAFIVATASKIPVFSGQARGTLGKPADKYSVPLDFPVKRFSTAKNALTGQALATTSSTYNNGVATFEWRTSLNYLVESEQRQSLSPTSPWNSLPYGVSKAKSVITSVYGLAIKNALLASITYSIN